MGRVKKLHRREYLRYIIGVDLGQAQDPTAVAAAEVAGDELHLRHLERLPLGTPYPAVIERIGVIAGTLQDCDLVVDATGVGRPVIDQMREQGLDPVAVTITGGRAILFDGQTWRVPKRALVRPLVAALEAGRLKVAKSLPEAEALVRELQAFKRQISDRCPSSLSHPAESMSGCSPLAFAHLNDAGPATSPATTESASVPVRTASMSGTRCGPDVRV